MESLWKARKGHPASDYCYRQMVPEVTNEIRQLDHAPNARMLQEEIPKNWQ